jgi:hypothetical protein
LNDGTGNIRTSKQTSLEKARREEIEDVAEFLSPKIDLENSLKYKSLKYKVSPGPK